MANPQELQFKVDGTSALTRMLLDAGEITFMLGSAINPAHQNPNLPRELGLKSHIANEIAAQLMKPRKTVHTEHF